MNESLSAHGAMIGLCLLVILGLSLSHIEVLWGRVRDFFNKFGEDEPDWS